VRLEHQTQAHIDISKFIYIYARMFETDRIFKALSDPARIKILEFLHSPQAGCCTFQGLICACDVERILDVSQATVSHHMKLLVDAGLVHAEKRGRWMHYTIKHDKFAQAMDWLSPFSNQPAKAEPACLPDCVSA